MRASFPLLLPLIVLIGAASIAAEGDRDETVQRLVGQLAQENDDKLRVEAVLLLGKVGGDDALKAVARAYATDPYPLVATSAAQVLGKTNDGRWIRLLATHLHDDRGMVAQAARLWVRKLSEAFAREKQHREGLRRWVDISGLDSVTRTDLDLELANRYRDAFAERIMKVRGMELGVEIEFEEADVMGSADGGGEARVTEVEVDERVPMLAEGAITKVRYKRGDDHFEATVSGHLRVVVLPMKNVACAKVSGTASAAGPIEDPDAEDADLIIPAIEALVEKLYAQMGPAVK